ncbi:tRNA(fMet)-specific endonuclease VapC [Fervidicola ferrireducens]|jgi:tRNA(fMet)-specific endonuclease VapC|uniref:Ribonuclease VapC n=1 Tax=Fervidicola ferrireducens TaxID=520764 RepID=A0A140L5K2_9FIRM|nr:type II toxin-antitoxin system VapC family toxin [Fervidicola ferrireducens]KXG75827.1 tRNA(fMet)-specific endonuclease VapC [Fervidicola ferrireducens]
MKYMLDTNICIYIIKKKPTEVIERFKKLDIGDICISSITLAELWYGVEKSQYKEKNRAALAAFIAPFEILPFSDKAATSYGEIRAFLEKRGESIGAYDLLIAAHALSENLTLVTNNVREFAKIPGLSVENWVE